MKTQPETVAALDTAAAFASEREKWDAYYSSLPLVEEDDNTRRFNDEFVAAVEAILPEGGRCLEAGAGAGWQSLALARTGKFEVSLLDFSAVALDYAKRVFARTNYPVRFIQADVADPGEPEFDLVFSAGVLEHYTIADQVRLLRGMKSRSRRFVLALVPNRRCYWYWIWRYALSSDGQWQWGAEVPADTLRMAFDKAGIRFLGERYFASSWTEHFISTVAAGEDVREKILAVHRSPIITEEQRGYLLAGLGAVDDTQPAVPGWTLYPVTSADRSEVLTAALADALALRVRDLTAESQSILDEKKRVADCLEALSARLAALAMEQRGAVERAERAESQMEWLRHQSEHARTLTAELNAALQHMREQYAAAVEQNKSLLQSFRLAEESLGQARKQNEKLTGEVQELESCVNHLKRELARTAEERDALSKRIGELSDQLRHLELARAEEERRRSVADAAAEQSRQQSAMLAAELDRLRVRLEELNREVGRANLAREEALRGAEELRSVVRRLEQALERERSRSAEAAADFGRQISAMAAHNRTLTDGANAAALERQALLRQNQELTSEVQRLENRIAGLDHEIEQAQAERRRLEVSLAESQERIALVEQSLADAEARKQQETEALRQSVDDLQMAVAKARADAERDRVKARELEAAVEALKRRVNTIAARYDSNLNRELEVLRSQRAWRLMLAARQAYHKWMREGWSGKLAALCTPFQLLAGGPDAFAAHDVRLPSIWDYLSELETAAPAPDRIRARTDMAVAGRCDVLVFPVFDFEFRFQRPQQIAAHLAGSGHRVFWVSPSRPHDRGSAAEPIDVVPLRERVFEVRYRGPHFRIYTDTLPPAQAEEIAGALAGLYRTHLLGQAMILVQFPFWRQVALELKHRFGGVVVYDCMDDWRSWTAEPRISEFALDEERKLAVECDVLAATSAGLSKRWEAEARRPVLRLRNGADFDFFRAAESGGLLDGIPRPIVGYYGAVADWVDTGLLAELAAARPNYSFVIIGEVHGEDISALKALPNVHLLGEKHYRQIPSYLRDFDVCLFPFKVNELTRAVDPVKIYEYLSQGKPVVATPLPEVCEHGDLVYRATGSAEFAAAIDAALSENSSVLAEARIAYAQANSWRLRADRLRQAAAERCPLASILVVSYNSREFLEPLVESLRRNTSYLHYELLVVDNGSTDGSAELLRNLASRYPEMRVILQERNLGFAAANNLGVRNSRGDYLVFLNADTIVPWGWLDRLLRPFLWDESIGLTAPVTNFSGNETRIETTYSDLDSLEHFARERARSEFGKLFELSMAPLLCAAVPRRVWSRVGELDEKFGLGMFEDDDFCLRIRNAGYRIVAVEDCFIHHFGNGSFAKIAPEESLALFEANRKYFETKWQISWTPHRMRPNVRPPSEITSPPLRNFLGGRETLAAAAPELELIRLHPDSTVRGGSVNRQMDGSSAIVVDCRGATPTTVIRFGDALLPTTFGNERLLSGVLPPNFSARAGVVTVTLVNDFGESNALPFRINP